MRPEWFVTIDAMRRAGWAVVTFSPHELQDADRQRFEERLDDYGADLVVDMAPEQEREAV